MKKLALTIGINNYHVSPLKGCVNDSNNMKQILEHSGYEVIQLLNEQATKLNIITTLTDIFENVNDGDKVFFTISSHGSYIPDATNTEADGRTEILCAYDLINADGSWNFENIITDDELFNIISKNPNVIVETLFDACHSCGSTRSIQPYILNRFVECPLTKNLPPIENLKRFNIIRDNVNIIEWAGCKSDQTSADAFINGNYQGAFTHFLFKHLGKTRQEIITNIQDEIKNAGFTQTPQLTCSDDKMNEPLFIK